MKEIILLILFSALQIMVNGQIINKELQNREVIIRKGDTLIKSNILTENTKVRPFSNRNYFWYLKGEINSNMGGYAGKLLHGNFNTLVNNSLIESGLFYKGLKDGKWTTWYQNGRIRAICHYKKGDFDGFFIKYNQDGSIEEELRYKKGEIIKESSFKKKVFKHDIRVLDTAKINR